MIYVDSHKRTGEDTSGVLITFDNINTPLKYNIIKALKEDVIHSRLCFNDGICYFIPTNNIDNDTLRDEILEYLETHHLKNLL